MVKKASAKKTKTKIHKIKAEPTKKAKKSSKTKTKVTTKVTTKKVEPKKKVAKTTKETKKEPTQKKTKKRINPIIRFIRYIKASWLELKKVRWPSRKETWQKVLSIIIYGLIFIVLVLVLDNLFDWLFKIILGAK